MTTPTDLQPDELVDITIRRAKVISTNADGGVLVAYGQEHSQHIELVRGNRVTVERIAPADWPPQIGDVWRDREDVLWFISIREVGDDYRPERVFTPSTTHTVPRYATYEADRLLAERGPLILVYREFGSEPGDEPDGADL